MTAPPHIRARYRTLRQTADAAPTLLSALAREYPNPHQGAAAFDEGLRVLSIEGAFDATDDPNFARLNQALRTLRRLKPLAKPRLIKACAAVALADDHVSARQGALLQGIAAALDCPLPPSIYSARH